MMTILFEDKDLEELIKTQQNGKYRKYARNARFMERLTAAYNAMASVERVSELRSYSYLHYEQLKYNGLSSVRVVANRVERILFRETEDGIVITILELNADHYGNKK